MAIYSEKEKELFFNYNRKEYKKLLEDKKYFCVDCINNKSGYCLTLDMKVSAIYICPNFKNKRENISNE